MARCGHAASRGSPRCRVRGVAQRECARTGGRPVIHDVAVRRVLLLLALNPVACPSGPRSPPWHARRWGESQASLTAPFSTRSRAFTSCSGGGWLHGADPSRLCRSGSTALRFLLGASMCVMASRRVDLLVAPGACVDPASLPRWDDPEAGLGAHASVQVWDLDAGVGFRPSPRSTRIRSRRMRTGPCYASSRSAAFRSSGRGRHHHPGDGSLWDVDHDAGGVQQGSVRQRGRRGGPPLRRNADPPRGPGSATGGGRLPGTSLSGPRRTSPLL